MRKFIAIFSLYLGFAGFCYADAGQGEVNFNCKTATCTTFEAIVGFGVWISYVPFPALTNALQETTAEIRGNQKEVYVQAVKDDAALYIADPTQMTVMLKGAIDQVRAQHSEAAHELSDSDLAAIVLGTP